MTQFVSAARGTSDKCGFSSQLFHRFRQKMAAFEPTNKPGSGDRRA
jgi:hypothetical protein